MASKTPHRQIIFVIGGVRSGKSVFAENTALNAFHATKTGDRTLTYIATAEPFDDEMRARIDAHKTRRGADWQLCDAPIDIAGAIRKYNHENSVILLDCTSVWTNNLLFYKHDLKAARAALLHSLETAVGTVIIVASETGLGTLAADTLSRQFCDANGLLNQAIASAADTVFFVVAGIAQKIKSPETLQV